MKYFMKVYLPKVSGVGTVTDYITIFSESKSIVGTSH